jgi:hypothetical protein
VTGLPVPDAPADPPLDGNEHVTLETFLDYQRAVMLRKVGGLSDKDMRRVMTASGLTLLGMMKHLAFVERWWFRIVFEGEEGVDTGWTDEDRDADWRVEPGETAEQIHGLFLAEVDRARVIAAAADMDDVAADPLARGLTMRWILVHMIEEYARHLGHADLMRETIDGQTGD